MPASPGYLALAGAGAVLLWAGFQGKSPTGVIRALIGGQSPGTAAGTTPISLASSTLNSGANSGSTGLGGGSIGSINSSATGSGAGGYQQYAFSLFPQFGWGADQESALVNLWNGESGWNPNAQNPTSTAYGIAQFLDTTWAPYGAKTSNPQLQVQYGLEYIRDRYGSPANAYSQWLSRNPHWY